MISTSGKLTPAARTRIFTCPSPAGSEGTSSSTSLEGGPYSLHNTAFMRRLLGAAPSPSRPPAVNRADRRGRPRGGEGEAFGGAAAPPRMEIGHPPATPAPARERRNPERSFGLMY